LAKVDRDLNRFSSKARGYKPALGLTGNDFDAHHRGRQRARLRERMSAWGRRALPRISALGIEVDVELAPEEESSDVLMFRTPAGEGAFVLRVDSEGVEVGLDLPRVTLASELSASHMMASLESLPEQFFVRSGGKQTIAQSTDLDVLRAARCFIGWRVERAVAIEHAELLDDQLEDALAALAGVLAVTFSERSKPKRAGAPKLSSGATRRPGSSSSAEAQIEKGAHVQVLHGPFAGKVGVVRELDGKGGARVLLGLLETRVDVADLRVDRDGRPRLGTSHRRPMPIRG
jgi:hypothetical protein